MIKFSFFLFLLFIFSSVTQAHETHSDKSCSSAETSFKDYNTTIKLLIKAREQLGKNGPERIAVYTFGKNNLYFNSDAFAELFRQSIYLYKIDLEETGKAKATTKHFHCSSHEIEIERGIKKYIQYIKTFGIETTAQTFEIANQHGLPFAAYFIITEILEHILFTPVIGLPVCKFLQGAYLFFATPIRNFLGVGLNTMGGYTQIPAHLVQAFQSSVYSSRFKRRMKSILMDFKTGQRFYIEKKQYDTVAQESTHFIEKYFSKTMFWAEAFTGFYLGEKEKKDAFSLDPTIGLQGDFNFIFNVRFKKELRHDRVERVIHGLMILKDLQSKLYEKSYFEKKNLGLVEYIKLRSFLGKFNKVLDKLRDSLMIVATTENQEAFEAFKPFAANYQALTEEIIWLFEDSYELTHLRTSAARLYRLSELNKGAKTILSEMKNLISKTRQPSSSESGTCNTYLGP